MADAMVRGYLLRATNRWLTEKRDPESQARIRKRISDQSREALETAGRTDWCSATSWNEALESICEEEQTSEDRYEVMRDVGRHIGTDAVATYLRLLLKLFTPAMLFGKFPSFFSRDLRPGQATADLSALDKKRVSLSIAGGDAFSYLAPTANGWLQYLFEQTGVKRSNIKLVRPDIDVVRSGEILLEVTWG